MDRKRQHRIIVIITLVLIVFLMLTLTAPGWGMPNQSSVRQTIPELTPQAYLPLVLNDYVGIPGGMEVPGR